MSATANTGSTARQAGFLQGIMLLLPVTMSVMGVSLLTTVAVAAGDAMLTRVVVRTAVSRDEVTLYVESSESGVEIVVRDHGVGFNADSVVAGGGFDRTFAAVRRRGGEVVITSTPGAGTKVSIRWRPS